VSALPEDRGEVGGLEPLAVAIADETFFEVTSDHVGWYMPRLTVFEHAVVLVRDLKPCLDELVERWGEEETKDLRELKAHVAKFLEVVNRGCLV
jgi:hypothetical protein